MSLKISLLIISTFICSIHVICFCTKNETKNNIDELVSLSQKHQDILSLNTIDIAELKIDSFLKSYLCALLTNNEERINILQLQSQKADCSFFTPLAITQKQQQTKDSNHTFYASSFCLPLYALYQFFFEEDPVCLPKNPIANKYNDDSTQTIMKIPHKRLPYNDLYKLHIALQKMIIDYEKQDFLYKEQHKILKDEIKYIKGCLELSHHRCQYMRIPINIDAQLTASPQLNMPFDSNYFYTHKLEQNLTKLNTQEKRISDLLTLLNKTQMIIDNFKKEITGPVQSWKQNPFLIKKFYDIEIHNSH